MNNRTQQFGGFYSVSVVGVKIDLLGIIQQ